MTFQPPGGNTNLAGILLVSTPVMRDPNFTKSIVLVSIHDPNQGAIGIVINKPADQCLADYDPSYAQGPLANAEVFYGGPMEQENLILTAWQWDVDKQLFKLYFGLTFDKTCELLEQDPKIIVRGFLGYAGWRYTQLTEEISDETWILAPIDENAFRGKEKDAMWRDYIAKHKPELIFLAQAPDDPMLN